MNQNNTLTPKEAAVADLVAQGLSNRAAGEKLGVSEKAIKFHLTSIYKKLGTTRYQLISRGPVFVGAAELTVATPDVVASNNGDVQSSISQP